MPPVKTQMKRSRRAAAPPSGSWATAVDEPPMAEPSAPVVTADVEGEAGNVTAAVVSIDVGALLNRGGELAEAGLWLQSLRAFDSAAQAEPGNAKAHEQRAQVLLQIGRPLEAVQAAGTACTLRPEWGDGRRTLARAQLDHGEVALALSSFDAALGLLLDSGDADDARECADEAERADGIAVVTDVRQRLREAGIDPEVGGVNREPGL